MALLAVAQTLLLLLTVAHESDRAQDEAEAVAAESAGALRRDLLGLVQALQPLAWRDPQAAAWREAGVELLRQRTALRHLEWRPDAGRVGVSIDSPYAAPLFDPIARRDLGAEAEAACLEARREHAPAVSRSYFVPGPHGMGLEVVDLCIPVQRASEDGGFVVGTVALGALLDAVLARGAGRRHELSLVEADGARLARAGTSRGAGVYVAERLVDLPGHALRLRVDSAAHRPSLIPNLAVALVLGLSIALFAVVLLLARDVRRRAQAEAALAETLAFRKAMEDSLSTGLRARDLQGRITYANPAFCAMVGYSLAELRAIQPPTRPPYWPPEDADGYAARQAARLAGRGRPAREAREGFETTFQRRSGERFPVMIYEAPLLDREGRQTGWMGAVVDLSAQRRVEDLARQQQERLQAAARLASVGEMASLLGHELNQPLAAIASYAAGSINLLEGAPRPPGAAAPNAPRGSDGSDGSGGPAAADPPDPETARLVRSALVRIAEQAERAGRVIKSVHDVVRRREQPRESLGADLLLEGVLPLVRLQARKSASRVELDLPAAPAPMPRVRCDRTLLEQVLLNLTRNALQAMEHDTAPEQRVLGIRVRQTHPRWVRFEVSDAGPGIAPEVAARLFAPFFTTRAEGMGLGLSLCRTVIEQHGGALDFGPGPGGHGTVFRFTLPAAPARASAPDGEASAAPATEAVGSADGPADLADPVDPVDPLDPVAAGAAPGADPAVAAGDNTGDALAAGRRRAQAPAPAPR